MNTFFASEHMAVQFTLGDDVFSFDASIENGIGMLTGFPQIGGSYDDKGFPFGMDAAASRYQALYLWEELQPTDERCLTQLGGLVAVRDGEVVYEYRDDGICAVADFEQLLKALA